MQQQQAAQVRNFQSRNPSTNQVVAEFPFLSDDETNKRIERSWQAFQAHSETDLATRREKILKLASLIERDSEKLAKIITEEMGKPIKASIGETLFSATQARYYADNAEKLLKPQVVDSGNKKSLIEYRPLGSIYYIVPFNFPFFLSFVGTVPCLLIGNTVLYRPADSTPRVGKAIEDLMVEAGFTNGEFQTVFTAPEQTELVLSNKHVRGVSFTGSTRSGRIIASIAGKYGKKATMELGGSDPFIVLDDADLEKAVDTALDSRLFNCGQVCCAAKRFIIDDNVYDKFKERLLQKVSDYKPADPLNPETKLGPLARPDLRANIERQVEQSLSQGAKLLYGGKRPEDPELRDGNFYVPAVFEIDKESNILFREETFGPVFALLRARGEDEIVRLANDTEYGLGCTIVSENIARASELGKKIDTGTIVFNGKVFPDIPTPFGGVKGSGFGRQYGEFGMHEFANIKTITTYES